MSFLANQAEIFNYETNYEVVNVSHLTQPSYKQNKIFSVGERKRAKKGKNTMTLKK